MKVRLTDSMVRFRLTREEVAALSRGTPVFLSMPVAPTSVTVRLEPIEEAKATMNSRGGLRVGLPTGWLLGWADSDVVGFDFTVADIRVVVEKDFPCSHDGEKPPKPVRMS